MTQEDVISGFKEFDQINGQCRFRDCQHKAEPGCAIIEFLNNNGLGQERRNSFNQIIRSLDDVTIK